MTEPGGSPGRPSQVRLLAALVLALVVSGCADDHGPDVPSTADAALDCAGAPERTGHGNYDSGPEDVQDDPRSAVDDWLDQEGAGLPDVAWVEAARRGDHALFTWSVGREVLAAFVVSDGTDGLDDHRGWGVTSFAACDPAEWPPETSDEVGVEVWSDAEGDRVPTSLVQSVRGPEHCGWEAMTFLFLGEEGADGTYYGRPVPELEGLLLTTYAEHVALPAEAEDTGYRRDGRRLFVTPEAAYVVTAGGDAERWPASTEPIGCD